MADGLSRVNVWSPDAIMDEDVEPQYDADPADMTEEEWQRAADLMSWSPEELARVKATVGPPSDDDEDDIDPDAPTDDED